MICNLLLLGVGLFLPAAISARQEPPPFPWVFTELAELETGDPEAGIGEIWAGSAEVRTVTVDNIGTVSLLDLITYSRSGKKPYRGIHRFDVQGRWIGNLTREGDGPGEFQSPRLISATGRGELVLYDPGGQRRVTHLDSNGRYINSFGIQGVINSMLECVSSAGTDRYWLVSVHPGPLLTEPFLDPFQEDILLVSGDSEVIWSITYDDIRTQHFIINQDNPGMAYPFPDPSARVAHWTFDDAGAIWILAPDHDRITRIDTQGATTGEIELDLEPILLDRTEIQQFADERTDRLRTSDRKGEQEYADQITRWLKTLKNQFAPIQRFWWIGPEGFLVDRVPVDPMAQSWREKPGRYLAIFPDGTISQEANGPGGLVAVANGCAVALRSHLDDLPKLALYRITPIVEGLVYPD